MKDDMSEELTSSVREGGAILRGEAPASRTFTSEAKLPPAWLDPPREFSVMPFWFWNDELDEAEIVRQIADFEAHGVYGFIIHPRVGLPRRCGLDVAAAAAFLSHRHRGGGPARHVRAALRRGHVSVRLIQRPGGGGQS